MPGIEWTKDQKAFLVAKQEAVNEARQRLALQILCNTNLDDVIAKDEPSKLRLCRRLKRLIERERLKGMRGHWGYDLNRHIGLKQALDRLKAAMFAEDGLAKG